MKITIESTEKIVTLSDRTLNGSMKARIWEGKTQSGIPVHCFIARIAAPATERLTEFENELQEHCAPSPDVAAYAARLIL